MRDRRGAAVLYTTEVTRTDLGRHAGRLLRGRAERRTLRIALGARRGLRLSGGRLRPVAIEVTEEDGRRYEVPIPGPPDPRAVPARRVVACWMIAAAALGVARLLRARAAAL